MRADEDGVNTAAVSGTCDLAVAGMGSGEGFGDVGDGEELSARMDARGGKHRQVRCSSS